MQLDLISSEGKNIQQMATAMFNNLHGKARALRDNGMDKAKRHADAEVIGWSDTAYQFLVDFIGRSDRFFMTEDVRLLAEQQGIPMPPDRRAWGAIMVRAFKAGIIKRIGYGQQHSANCHMSPKSIWVRK